DLVADPRGTGGVGPNATWFNTAAFRQPRAGTFGSEGIGVVRGPGLKNLDLSLQKSFRVTESKRLEFRVEAFNFTNTPIFNAPDVNVNSTTFGQVLTAQGERNIQFALKLYFGSPRCSSSNFRASNTAGEITQNRLLTRAP